MLDRVQVRRVWGQVFEPVSRLLNSRFCVGPFVESGVVHTAFAARAVAMRPRHVVRKATFVNINNGLSRLTMRLDPFAEGAPIAVVRLWVPEGFFYMSPPVCAGPERWHSGQHQSARHARADRRRDLDAHPAPEPPDRSCACAARTDPAPGASTNGKEKRARHQISARFPGPSFLRGDRTRRRKSMQ